MELPEPAPGPLPNRSLARFILAGMGLLAGAALVFALLTTPFRRQNDYRRQDLPPEGLTHAPTDLPAPAELAALGYLPADCQAVAGLNVTQLQSREEGRKLLDRFRSGNLFLGLGQVEQWTGLKATEIDHLALGVRLDQDLPRFTLVVRTRKTYSLKALEQALAPARPAAFAGRPAYPIRLGPMGQAVLWCRDDSTMVLAINLLTAKLDDLKELPAEPRKTIDALAPSLREALTGGLNREAFLWVAGEFRDTPRLQTWLQVMTKSSPQTPNWLTRVQAFRAGARFHEGLTLDAALQASDEAAARQLQELLEQQRPPNVESYKVFGPGSKSQPANAAEDNTWVVVQVRSAQSRCWRGCPRRPARSLGGQRIDRGRVENPFPHCRLRFSIAACGLHPQN